MENGGQKVLVLYQVANAVGDKDQYNAFEMPKVRGGIKLSTVKKHCLALQNLNAAGSAGYLWRVRVDDRVSTKSSPNSKPIDKYSWWDIQDDEAPLPMKEATFAEINQILAPPRKKIIAPEPEDSVTKAAGAMRKAMSKVAATVEGSSSTGAPDIIFPRVVVLVFRLLDLTKIYDSSPKQQGHRSQHPNGSNSNYNQRSTHAPNVDKHTRHPLPTKQKQVAPANAGRNGTSSTARRNVAPTTIKQDNLLDFNDPAPTISTKTPVENLVEKYQKAKKQELVWDEVDQRYVTPESKGGESRSTSKPKVKGISLDASNTVGKSAHVASAMRERVNNMEAAQQKALNDIRERESKKKQDADEEDQFRQKVDPLIKEWSEEHGKKKQLAALLANLHTVLWPGAKWTQVNLGELLDANKCRKAFYKASRVVHPDRVISLPAEQRFLAKRIFDALKQAKSQIDK